VSREDLREGDEAGCHASRMGEGDGDCHDPGRAMAAAPPKGRGCAPRRGDLAGELKIEVPVCVINE